MSEFRTRNEIILPVMDKQDWIGGIRLKNGEVIDMTEVAYINAWNPMVGLAVEYGFRTDVRYDQFMINEKFGGGNAVGVYFQYNGRVYVGLIQEKRNGGQLQWELPRFFCGVRNDTRRASFQENLEKDQFDYQKLQTMDCPVNCNSAYNFTASNNEGLQLFFVEIEYDPERLLYDPDEDTFVFHDLLPIERDKSTKKIVNSMFFNIDNLCANQDVFASAWVGKFWTLVRKDKIILKPYIPEKCEVIFNPRIPENEFDLSSK